jgi:hypothetical protein
LIPLPPEELVEFVEGVDEAAPVVWPSALLLGKNKLKSRQKAAEYLNVIFISKDLDF